MDDLAGRILRDFCNRLEDGEVGGAIALCCVPRHRIDDRLPEHVDWAEDTLLCRAARHGRVASMALALKAGANLAVGNGAGATPFFLACMEGQTDAMRLLKSWGADIEAADDEGMTPLHVACQEGNLEVVRLLKGWGVNLNRADENGWVPLFDAIDKGHVAIVEQLCWWGVDFRPSPHGQSPRQYCAENTTRNLNEMLRLLREVADHGSATKWAEEKRRQQRRVRRWPLVRALALLQPGEWVPQLAAQTGAQPRATLTRAAEDAHSITDRLAGLNLSAELRRCIRQSLEGVISRLAQPMRSLPRALVRHVSLFLVVC